MKNWKVALFVAVALAFGQTAIAQTASSKVQVPPTRAAINAACKPGSDPQIAGDENYPGGLATTMGKLTPTRLPGATTISAREAKCIIDHFGANVLVLAAMDDPEHVPNAVKASAAASPDAALQPRYAEALSQVASEGKTQPIIVYCHHESCFLSYNVALRTVMAGYTNVFWMRPGMAGWKKAGYSVVSDYGGTSPAPSSGPDNKSISTRLTADIAECRKEYLDYSAEKWAQMLTQIPTVAEQDKEFAKDRDEAVYWYNLCLTNIRDHGSGSFGAADRQEIASVLGKAKDEVIAQFEQARRDVEANPAKYLAMTWDDHKPEKLRHDLAVMKEVKTLEQTCGQFDLAQPPVGPSYNNYVDGLNARRIQHGECITQFYKTDRYVNNTFGITSANKWVHATARFTCAATHNKPNCIPNEPFNTIASIASDSNAAYIERQDKLYFEQRARVGSMLEAENAWIKEVNRRVAEYNSSH